MMHSVRKEGVSVLEATVLVVLLLGVLTTLKSIYGPEIDDAAWSPEDKNYIFDQSTLCHMQCVHAGFTEDSQEYWECIDRCLYGN